MTSILSSHSRLLKIHEYTLKNKSYKVQCLGYSGVDFPCGGILCAQGQQNISFQGKFPHPRLVLVRAVSEDAESRNEDDSSEKNESTHSENKEDLERLIGKDDSTFSGVDLATLIRKKYGRSYDVQLIKKQFMGKKLLAMNVMWKYVEQRSFPLTEEEYLLRLDDVANNLKCWGAVSHIRNSLEKLKERPRIGKAVCIFIDMDESGGRANEWIYK